MVVLNKDNPWHIVNPKMLGEIKKEISEHYPKFQLEIRNRTVFVKGPLELLDKNNELIDDFFILIAFPYNYPDGIPFVQEIGGRIPMKADRHINSPHGNACLFVPEEREKRFPLGSSFRTFMEECITPFFVSQSYFEKTGKWLFGQRPHGLKGVLDYYKEEYPNTATKVFNQLIHYIAKRGVKEKWPCYCDSGLELKKCHLKYLNQYRQSYRKQAKHLRKTLNLFHIEPKPVSS